MKVGIITITWGTNYGNRLQNYAVQKICEDMGCEVETFHRKYDNISSMKQQVKKAAVKLYGSQHKLQNAKLNLWEREVKFSRFNDKYIHFSDKNAEEMTEAELDKYDCFITGSDQVWNPNYLGFDKYVFLDFGGNQKRVAISPSFGIDELPERYKRDVAMNLKKFDALSVREETGADIIKELTGNRPQVLIDPTMMLSAENWLQIASEPKRTIKKPYILTYFLGEKNEKVSDLIEQLRHKYSLNVIDIPVLDFSSEWHSTDPPEFVWLISNAQCILTDSFHGTVFSILFEKPFVVTERRNEQINSRIDTLLRKFEVRNRYLENISFEDILKPDYKDCHKILENERERMKKFLSLLMER